MDDGLSADRHAVIRRRLEAANRLLLAVLEHCEVVSRQLTRNQIAVLVGDHHIQNDNTSRYFESLGRGSLHPWVVLRIGSRQRGNSGEESSDCHSTGHWIRHSIPWR